MNGRMVSDPGVMMGKPVIAGTRITVEHIVQELAEGRSMEQLLDAYPRLTRYGVQAALSFSGIPLGATLPQVGPVQL